MESVNVPKSASDLDILLQEVNESPYIGQLSREELQSHIQDGTIRFFYNNDQIVGFGAWDRIGTDWIEIGPFYNLTKYRGQGFGTQIVESLTTLNAGKKLYAVTKNPIVEKLLLRLGFHQTSGLALPWPIYRHLLARLSPRRLLHLAQKISPEPIAHFIKTA